MVLRSLVSHVARRVPLRSRLRDSSGSGGGGGGGGGGSSSSSSDGRQQQQQRRAAAAATTTASLNFSSGGLGLGFSRGAASVYCSTETTIRDVSNRFPLLSYLHIKTNILQDRLGTNIGKTPKRVVIKRSSHLMKGVDCVLRKTQKTISVVFLSFSLNYLC